MATPEEVKKVTGCLPGAVPPFSSCFLLQKENIHIPIFVDESLKLQGEVIHFNCGLRTRSVQMTFQDYVMLEQPILANFTV